MANELVWRMTGGGDEIAPALPGSGAYELWCTVGGYLLQYRVGGDVRLILRDELSRAKAKEAAQEDWDSIAVCDAAVTDATHRHGMLNPQRGDTLVRITPPADGRPGYSQPGTVDRVTQDTIELIVQVDIPRRMVFRRSDGYDAAGLGTFVVPV